MTNSDNLEVDMGKRGPKPGHETFVSIAGGRAEMPKPPEDMTEAQKTLWESILRSEPTHLFDSAARLQLLRAFVEHATFRADLQALINKTDVEVFADPDLAKTVEQMLRARDRETKQLVTLATKLRLTNQSRYSAHVAEAAGRNDIPPGPRPWDTEEPNPFAQFDEPI